MEANAGKYVCIVEGAIPTKDERHLLHDRRPHGRSTSLSDVAGKAGAIIAIGSCASWGGVPSADPNPTGAVGAHEVLKGKTVVNIPGCPANPYNLLGTVLQYATYGTLPALDAENRPKFAYGSTIHEHCPRRAHFDAGTLRAEVRRRGTSARLLPLQARVQGPGDARQLLRSALRRGRRCVADRPRASVLRLHRAEDRVPRAAARDRGHRSADAAGHVSADPRARRAA